MTLTLELPAEIENAIAVKAQRRGVTLEKYLSDLAERDAQAPEVLTEAPSTNDQKPLSARQQAALDGYGKYAGRGRTSDDLIRDRREEAATEMAQAARRDAGDFS